MLPSADDIFNIFIEIKLCQHFHRYKAVDPAFYFYISLQNILIVKNRNNLHSVFMEGHCHSQNCKSASAYGSIFASKSHLPLYLFWENMMHQFFAPVKNQTHCLLCPRILKKLSVPVYLIINPPDC